MSDLAEEKHDQNKDSFLQLNEFVEFMWETAPKFVKEAKTNSDLRHNSLDWLEDIQDRAKSAGFSLADHTRNPNLQTKFNLTLNPLINLTLLPTLTLLSTLNLLPLQPRRKVRCFLEVSYNFERIMSRFYNLRVYYPPMIESIMWIISLSKT